MKVENDKVELMKLKMKELEGECRKYRANLSQLADTVMKRRKN
jgi:hypothetical protein